MKTYITIIEEDGTEYRVKAKVEVLDPNRITKEDIVKSVKDGFTELKTDLGRATKIMWKGYWDIYCEAYAQACMAAAEAIRKGFKETSDMMAETYL